MVTAPHISTIVRLSETTTDAYRRSNLNPYTPGGLPKTTMQDEPGMERYETWIQLLILHSGETMNEV